MTNKEIFDEGSNFIMNTYGRYNIVPKKGDGCYVECFDGKKYLDFFSGIAVNSLGYNNEKLVNAIKEQAADLIHISNIYYNKPQVDLAKCLILNSAFDKVFFCNSGAEAIEAAIKLCRKYKTMKNKKGYDIITMKNSFHGRTLGALTATAQPKYQEGLMPLLSGFKYVDYNDVDMLRKTVDENTCGILIEVIQGEGGIVNVTKEYMQEIRKICDEKDILFMIDEVQTGVGRTGKFFAFENFGVEPDCVTLAKGLAGGVPIGAMLAKDKFADAFKPGDHGSTFGGNPLATACGLVVLEELFENGLLTNVNKQAAYLTDKLNALKEKYSFVEEVKGMGLLQGIKLSEKFVVGDVVLKCLDKGVLLVGAGNNVLRFAPPLIITEKEIDALISVLEEVFDTL